jgi:hypothetical protein
MSNLHWDIDAMGKLVVDAILARLDALEHHVLGHTRRRETRAERARRKGVSTRTIARRVADGTEEKPEIVNGRWYFWADEPDQPQPDTPATAQPAHSANRRLLPPMNILGGQQSNAMPWN